MPSPLIHAALRCATLAALLASAQAGEQAARLVASKEPGWPQFRGPRRDGICTETGLLQSWPEGGPKQVWSASGLGRGYCSPIISRGRLYITGDVGDDLMIFAFDLAGKLKWKTTNGRSWRRSHRGSRASCTLADGRLYHMNAHGRAACLDPADGSELWAVDVLERFAAKNIQWGISDCLLVDDKHVYVTPGGPKTLMAALDKRTGATVWTSEPLRFERTHRFGGRELKPPVPDTDKAGYASPILFELGGRRLLAGCSARHLFCVDAVSGKLLWTHPVWARWEVIGAIPVLWRDALFFTVPDSWGGRLFRIHASPHAVRLEELWETPLDNCHGALVAVDGRLYGAGYHRFRHWACVDAATGKVLYAKRDLAKGSALYADGRLYALAENGLMTLLKPTDAGFESCGQFWLVQPRPPRKRRPRDVWPHPVVHHRRLYLRYHDTLRCYDVSSQSPAAAPHTPAGSAGTGRSPQPPAP